MRKKTIRYDDVIKKFEQLDPIEREVFLALLEETDTCYQKMSIWEKSSMDQRRGYRKFENAREKFYVHVKRIMKNETAQDLGNLWAALFWKLIYSQRK